MFKDKTILLVDEEIEVIEKIKEILKNTFRRVLTASEGDECLNLYYRHRPDIVIADYSTPYINGVELISIIKSEFPKQKVAIMSGYVHSDLASDLKDNDIAHFICKPIIEEEFLNGLKKLYM